MYRLINLRTITQTNIKLLTYNRFNDINQISNRQQKLTSLCNNHFTNNIKLIKRSPSLFHNDKTYRWNSSTPKADLLKKMMKKRKKKTKIKKYTELVEVTDTSSLETKASVQPLKSHKLSEFIEKPLHLNSYDESFTSTEYSKNINLQKYDQLELKADDEKPIIFVGRNINQLSKEQITEIIESLHSIKDSLHETPDIEHIAPSRRQNCLMDDGVEIESEISDRIDDIHPELQLQKKRNIDQTSKNNESFKSKTYKSPVIEKMARSKTLAIMLSSYLDMCVANNMVNRGMATILNYRFKSKKYENSAAIVDVKLYNILLQAYAAKGNFMKIKDILQILDEDSIKYNAQTYAAIFECLGRLPLTHDSKYLLHEYRVEASKGGFTLNDIVDKSVFVSDQRDIVVKAIRFLDPSFVVEYTPSELNYSNNLVNALNENVIPINEIIPKNERVRGCEIMNSKRGFSGDELLKLAREQLNLELEGTVTVKSIQNHPDPTKTVLLHRERLKAMYETWHKQICVAFNRDCNTLRAITQCKSNRSINLYPFLRALNVEDYANILMKEIRTLAEGSETYSPTIGQLYREFGQKVQIRYHMEQKKKNGVLEKTGEIYSMYSETLGSCNSSDNPRQLWQRLVHQTRNDGPSMDIEEKVWPMSILVGVGRFMYNILMRDLKIDVNAIRSNSKTQNFLPAFYTIFRNQGRLIKEEVKPHPVLSKLYRGAQLDTLTFDCNLVPMLCPPQPWSTSVNGGYLLAKSELIRLPQQALQQISRIKDMPAQNLYPALDSLNQLASIPWKVNSELLDVILTVFNNDGSAQLDVPQPPHTLQPLTDNDPNKELTKSEKFKKFRQKLSHKRKQAEMYSLWCDALYRLSLANHFRDKVFWLPHNMDFRGRVYPIPPHLNHLGSDLARSLLIFHQAKPLGPDGFDWLKLHCINLTGLKKKCSTRERLMYAEEIMDDILDSADHPLTGRMWWSKSDEPWQTLGCCKEIAKVHRSTNPAEYESCFPIHQDGSCNGLQHYAALGRDTAGAVSVNLAPSALPQDVYSDVALLVEESRRKDAANGLEVAKKLENYVQRKVIKQTVMTTVYGVTRFGARLQIARQLKDIDSFPKDWVWPASSYLTGKTFESLREMFTSTKEIQDWFTDCARLISAVCAQNVEWVTPLGLPVVQPYNRNDKVNLPKTNNIAEHFQIDMFNKPNIMKQKNAFPPNFIHSLDSSHMMLTSLHCEREGLTFISVHDCFWTHACTVADMNKICREQFVSLHSQPILEDLSDSLQERFSFDDNELVMDGSVKELTRRKLNRAIQQLPKKGDFDLNNVLNSVYFFS